MGQILDEEKTIKNVTQFLGQHRIRILRAERSYNSLQSPNMDGMPKNAVFDNKAESTIVERVQTVQEVKETIRAIKCLDRTSNLILNRLFIDCEPSLNQEVMNELGYERTRYSELKRRALVGFAESYLLEDFRIFKKSEHLANTIW